MTINCHPALVVLLVLVWALVRVFTHTSPSLDKEDNKHYDE